MQMKKFMLTLVGVWLALAGTVGALSAYDSSLIYRQLQIISNHVNNIRDSDTIDKVIAPGHENLLKAIDQKVSGKMVQFTENVSQLVDIGNNQVKVIGTFSAEGKDGTRTWKNSGNDFFVFQNINQKWLLVDTDFYKPIGKDKVEDKQQTEKVRVILGTVTAFIVLVAGYVLLKKKVVKSAASSEVEIPVEPAKAPSPKKKAPLKQTK